MRKLTKKQKVFVDEYLIDLNATQAAIRAGYSKKTANNIGPELLGKTCVANAVQEAIKKREQRNEITQDRVLNEIAKLAFSNIQDIYDKDGELIPIDKLPRDVAAAIQEINQDSISGDDNETIIKRKYKLSDKKASLELLGKHLGIFTEKIKIEGELSLSEMSKEEKLARISELTKKLDDRR